ncbi:biotin-dependent carboxyltransferase family protein [Gracilibacillus sp. YIM 98692]|uniref:5-oxoprolinase subunit C family protein n=1 Tax=Gracilibacillus sp. YIM 98692 TaxID=2663532 RepID=UPI0013D6306A|nr:biotin-dependent carboxyltransferase family protein [Gracilibacillus sp. YIM 98692]
MTLEMIEEGLYTTIQDLGRFGYRSKGFPVSGAMDSFAMQVANILVGNQENEAVMEMSFLGPTIRFTDQATIVITGADMGGNINDKPIPRGQPISVSAGDILQFRTTKEGLYCYLAVKGGFDITPILGSKSTIVRAEWKGMLGRKLEVGDRIPLKESVEAAPVNWRVNPSLFHYFTKTEPVIRYIKGAQSEWFNDEAKMDFESHSWQTTTQSNRMGYRLKGTAVPFANDKQLLTEATSFGAIQVPPDGQPIVLMADGQPTGGYPKIGQVIQADLPKLSQSKPGIPFRFKECSIDDALKAKQKQNDQLKAIKLTLCQKWGE